MSTLPATRHAPGFLTPVGPDEALIYPDGAWPDASTESKIRKYWRIFYKNRWVVLAAIGCCLGITVGLLISVLLGVIGLGPLVASAMVFLIHTDAITNTRIATAFFALIGAILGAYFGWKIGKRLYREFEPPVIKDRTRKPKTRPKEAKL